MKKSYKAKIKRLKAKLKVKQQRIRRMRKKIESLEDLTRTLSKKRLISDSHEELLNGKFSGMSSELFKRMINMKKSGRGLKYSPELKSLALTLQFYSTKAYKFVRKIFNFALPHPDHISKWYSSIPAEPGFTEPSFHALKLKVQESERKGITPLYSLMFDEMSLKQLVEWDGKRWRGFVDLGDEACDENSPVAKDALVFMVVAVNGYHKVPVGYFPIAGMTGREKANLVNVCLDKLTGIGVHVVSLTCDGPPSHFAMMAELGASFKVDAMKTFFLHSSEDKKIYTFLDICHMLKLVRNNFKKVGVMYDRDGNRISWEYLEKLAKLQEDEGLRYLVCLCDCISVSVYLSVCLFVCVSVRFFCVCVCVCLYVFVCVFVYVCVCPCG